MATSFSTNSFTASIWNKPRALQEGTNLEVVPLVQTEQKSSPCVSAIGLYPHPRQPLTNLNNASALKTNVNDQRRIQRYSIAEEELAAQFRQCNSEPSSRELQIRALEKATSMLSAHAQESRERAERLRAMLADRQVDPDVYETLKRERWMEDKRQSVFDLESKVVLQHLQNLVYPTSPTIDDEELSSQEARRYANLIKFFEVSQACAVRSRKALTSYYERSPRRRTIDRVSPLRLHASPSSYPLFRRHSRSVSLSGPNFTVHPTPKPNTPVCAPKAPHPPFKAFLSGQSLNVLPEAQFFDSDVASQSSASISSYLHTPTELSPPTPLPVLTTETICPPHDDLTTLSLSSATNPAPETGTATIYLPQSHSLPSINAADIYAPLPDYALDLFSRFERTDEIQYPPQPTSTPDLAPYRLLLGPASIETPPHAAQTKDDSRPNSMPPPSALPKIPTPTTNLTSSQDPNPRPRLGRSRSHRHLGLGSSLFSIPEAISSRLRVDSGEHAKGPSASALGIAEDDENIRIGQDGEVRLSKGHMDLKMKIRRRFSAIRLARS